MHIGSRLAILFFLENHDNFTQFSHSFPVVPVCKNHGLAPGALAALATLKATPRSGPRSFSR